MWRWTSTSRNSQDNYARRTYFAVIAAILVLAACAGEDAVDQPESADSSTVESDTSAVEPAELEPVSMLLGWRANGTFSPAFLARERGFFEEEGLDVDIQQGGPGAGVELVANGDIDFILGGIDSVPLGIQEGMDIRSVGIVAETDPSGIVVLGSSDIHEPGDLAGKRIGGTPGGGPQMLLPAYLEAVGIDSSDVEIISLSAEIGNTAVLTENIDATSELRTVGYVAVLAADPEARFFPYADYGISLLSTGIITTNATIETRPETVRGFVRAILRAYQEAENNPSDAIAAASIDYPEAFAEAEIEQASLEQFFTLMRSDATAGQPFGYSSEEQWQQTLDTLAEFSGLEDVQPLDTYYTNDFIPDDLPE